MHKIVKISKDTIIGVVSDIDDKLDNFNSIVDSFKPSDKRILVSIGNVYNKNNFKAIVDKFSNLKDRGIFYSTYGNRDIVNYLSLQGSGGHISLQLEWIICQPSAISFVYPNGKSILCLNSGIGPAGTTATLGTSEVAYVQTIAINNQSKDRVSWHDLYDGRFGYICAGNTSQNKPTYHKYSCCISTKDKLTCQTFNHKGLGNTVELA